ncbi:multidrug and toxin extrusion protein 1-like [Saccoglossus kowalevskii]|uniref:Multidrug and toxin extrusion protein n=1 Tax=Saccoglossus kowalevskii TaxID=10224 RepID=A0ABM0GTJ4_SACKO|nr:PREDICTED: multidrug and toxin extrusion protein 1-like [Saccoglossus kowalevskii]
MSSSKMHASRKRAKSMEFRQDSETNRPKKSAFGGRFFKESKELLALALPLVVVEGLDLSFMLITIIVCGHIGKEELDASALALSLIKTVGVSIAYGLIGGINTLFSQTHGSGNKKQVGVILQRSIFILTLTLFPCATLYYNAETFLLIIRQEPKVARMAGAYCKILIPYLLGENMVLLVRAYLRNQNIVAPIVVSYLITTCLHILLSYLFVFQLSLGISGAGLALVASVWILLLVMLLYIKIANLHKETWAGWSTESLYDWNKVLVLGIPSAIMICIEWWSWEIVTFMSGTINETQLAVSVIIYQITSVSCVTAFGMSSAVIARVGNFLGAYKPKHAQITGRVALVLTGMIAICLAIAVFFTRDYISLIFTEDKEVRQLTSRMLIISVLIIIFVNIGFVQSAILNGCGQQRIGAILNIIVYYFIGLPVGVFLLLVFHAGIAGFWVGILSAAVCQCFFFNITISKLNWKNESEKAQERAGVEGREEYIALSTINEDESPEEVKNEAEKKIPSSLLDIGDVTEDEVESADKDSNGISYIPEKTTFITLTDSRYRTPSLKVIIAKRVGILLLMTCLFCGGVVTGELLTPFVRATFIHYYELNNTLFLNNTFFNISAPSATIASFQ